MSEVAEGSIEAFVVEDGIAVRSPYSAYEIIGTVPGGVWRKPRKVWEFPRTPLSAHNIFDVFTQNGYAVHCDRPFVELCAQAQKSIAARAFKSANDLPEIPGDWCACDARQPGDDEKGENPYYCVNCSRPLGSWDHQKQAFHFVAEQTGAGFAVGMGGGKSKLIVATLEHAQANVVLIGCPNNVVPVWPKEFAKHQSQEWRVWAGEVRGRSGKALKKPTTAQRAEAIEDFLRDAHGRPSVVVVNFEAMWQGKLGELLLSIEWDYVALDESHRIKAPGGAASKFCAKLRNNSKKRLCATGTLQPHSPLDVYAQARFLDPSVLGTNFAKFRRRYAILREIVKEGRSIPIVEGFQNEEELSAKIAQLFYVISQEELDESLGLEVPTEYDVPVVLGEDERKTYDKVWNEYVADFGELGEVVADNALTRILRVQQITSGHVGTIDDDENRHVVTVGTSKADRLKQILEDSPQENGIFEPIVVFCRFKHDLREIERVTLETGRTYGELSGDSKSGMYPRDDVENGGTMLPGIDVLGVQINSGGVGIDLTRACHAIFYSIGHSLGDYLQARKRVHRPGQVRHVTIQHLVAQGTIDEAVYAALKSRKQIVDAVNDAAKHAHDYMATA